MISIEFSQDEIHKFFLKSIVDDDLETFNKFLPRVYVNNCGGTNYENVPLTLCCYQKETANRIKMVESLLSANNVNIVTSDIGSTPIMFATQKGNTVITALLIKNGADLNIKNTHGYDALFYNISYENPNPNIIKQLVEAGAFLNRKYEYTTIAKGFTALHIVVYRYSQSSLFKKIIVELLKAKPDLSLVTESNETIRDFIDKYIGDISIYNLFGYEANILQNIKFDTDMEINTKITTVTINGVTYRIKP